MNEKVNFMDKFETAEDFIRYSILSNRGTQNVLNKSDLISIAVDHDIYINPNKITNSEIYSCIRKKVSLEEICEKCSHLGVSSHSFQMKFDITYKEVKQMASSGFINVTGYRRYIGFHGYCYAILYSVFDYYRLTKEDVHNWLSNKNKKQDF